jgi:Na+-driven multidrug efflux pump
MSHTKKTAVNSLVGIACTLISSILSFVLQSTFIKLLGLEYSGVNGLFTDILKILNLAELGISNAILFRLYKQISENNTKGIEKFLFFYKKVCYGIGFIILAVGLCLTPFLNFFVKETPVFPEKLWSLYLIVLLTSVFTQIFNYKSALITAKQDIYINTIINYSSLFLLKYKVKMNANRTKLYM